MAKRGVTFLITLAMYVQFVDLKFRTMTTYAKDLVNKYEKFVFKQDFVGKKIKLLSSAK